MNPDQVAPLANSVDPDQTAPIAGSILFAKITFKITSS